MDEHHAVGRGEPAAFEDALKAQTQSGVGLAHVRIVGHPADQHDNLAGVVPPQDVVGRSGALRGLKARRSGKGEEQKHEERRRSTRPENQAGRQGEGGQRKPLPGRKREERAEADA